MSTTRSATSAALRSLDLLGNDFAIRLAKGSAEVLFDAPVPAGAINVIK